ncbi:MAG: VacJ family lipoprotein [Aquisalimonadaceae bacterium]
MHGVTLAGRHPAWLVVLAAILLTGCATTPPTPQQSAYDPIEPANRRVHGFNAQLDRFVAKPLADAYAFVTPRVVRRSVTNFFDNASYPGTILNAALQGKWRQSGRDTGRFLVNTTIGVFGLFDPATPLGLEENDEDFGQTLAVWGAPEGMYIVLPAAGSTTSRDIHSYPLGAVTNVVTYLGGWSVVLPLYALDLINLRANLEQASRFRSEAALDDYSFTRSAYRQYRDSLIFDGDVPEDDPFDDLEDW